MNAEVRVNLPFLNKVSTDVDHDHESGSRISSDPNEAVQI